MTTIDIRLRKVSKIYHENESVAGVVIFESSTETKHDGISLGLEGAVTMQLSSKSVGRIESFMSSIKPVVLVSYSVEIVKPGKLPKGKTEVPFEFPLKPKQNRTLFETYHGVFINIKYELKCELRRKLLLAKNIEKTLEFMVEYSEDKAERGANRPINISISPESLQNVKDRSQVPNFLIRGRIDSTQCRISQPFTGVLAVDHCDRPIRSIELQLVRVETCGCAEGYARDATEIQNIQIGEGDVCHGINIPIYMVFPRLFTCPTLITSNFKIEFDVNVVVVFEDDHLITENYSIKITRF